MGEGKYERTGRGGGNKRRGPERLLRIYIYTARQGKAKEERKEEKGWDRMKKDRTGRERTVQEEKGWDRKNRNVTGKRGKIR